MLSAAVLSFLVNKRLHGKKYVAIMVVATVLMSFLSAFGWIEITLSHFFETHWNVRPVFPLPISFPFVARVYLFDSTRDSYPVEVYDLFFFGAQINREYTSYFLPGRGFLYYSFFLLVNIIGSIIGYWISSAGFVELMLRKKRPKEHSDHPSLRVGDD